MNNVKPSYVEDDWNSCTITPPAKYQSVDLIIRKKGIEKYSDNCTFNPEAYRLAFCSGMTKKFMKSGEEEAFHSNEDLAEFEYKVIK